MGGISLHGRNRRHRDSLIVPVQYAPWYDTLRRCYFIVNSAVGKIFYLTSVLQKADNSTGLFWELRATWIARMEVFDHCRGKTCGPEMSKDGFAWVSVSCIYGVPWGFLGTQARLVLGEIPSQTVRSISKDVQCSFRLLSFFASGSACSGGSVYPRIVIGLALAQLTVAAYLYVRTAYAVATLILPLPVFVLWYGNRSYNR